MKTKIFIAIAFIAISSSVAIAQEGVKLSNKMLLVYIDKFHSSLAREQYAEAVERAQALVVHYRLVGNEVEAEFYQNHIEQIKAIGNNEEQEELEDMLRILLRAINQNDGFMLFRADFNLRMNIRFLNERLARMNVDQNAITITRAMLTRFQNREDYLQAVVNFLRVIRQYVGRNMQLQIENMLLARPVVVIPVRRQIGGFAPRVFTHL
ncbi:MAG: hypothetical protein WCK42_04255 [Myxococcaceae bacterium]